ncbi:MAG: pentapeptide repeat-containing protein, partial [Chloroflexi bacterium]|nr:pentapeptide repeat-containing protein [Chloroflexota bacterium]
MHIPMQWAVIAHRHDRGSKMTTDEPTPQQIEAVAAYLSLLSSRGSLANADLRGLDLRKQDLHGKDLRGANLSDANLSDANLSDANLSDAN